MQTLTTEELEGMLGREENIPLINVLSEESYQKAHIPDSDNIPLESDDFVKQIEEKAGGKDKPVIVYCASTDCDASPNAAKKLEQAGFTKVYDYDGGIKAWKESGHEVRGRVPTG